MRTYPEAMRAVGKPLRSFATTGEFRPPKRGEWYLSGAIGEAYQAPNDLSTAYNILRIVGVQARCPACGGAITPPAPAFAALSRQPLACSDPRQ